MAPRQVEEVRVRKLVKGALAQPGCPRIKHCARDNGDRTASIVGKHRTERPAAVRYYNVISAKRERLPALVHRGLAPQLQVDGIVISGSPRNVARGADDLVAGRLTLRESERTRIAYREASRELFRWGFGRNTKQ